LAICNFINEEMIMAENISPMPQQNGLSKDENSIFWEHVREAQALRVHAIVGKRERHYLHYIDTDSLLSKKLDDLTFPAKQEIYQKDKEPEVILFTNNFAAFKIAQHLISDQFNGADAITVLYNGDDYEVPDIQKLKDKRILIVTDVAITGTSLNKFLNLCEAINTTLDNVKICILINRLSKNENESLHGRIPKDNILSIYRIPIPSFAPPGFDCPLCREIERLNTYKDFMNHEAQKYIERRLKEINKSELQHVRQDALPLSDEKLDEDLLNTRLADQFYRNKEEYLNNILNLQLPIEQISRLLMLISVDYLNNIDLNQWILNLVDSAENSSQLTKIVRFLLNLPTEKVIISIEKILKKYAEYDETQDLGFASYFIDFLVHDKKLEKHTADRLLYKLLKEYKENDFISNLMLSFSLDPTGEKKLRPSIAPLYKKYIVQAAPYDVNILITGETGTGKEEVAKIIHKISDRAKRAFIYIDIPAYVGELFESELFGHKKGSFTNAIVNKNGLLPLADGGIAFLDEIGDIPLNQQVKLLRAIQDKKFKKVGETKYVESDFRLICATHKPLLEMIKKGEFRSDLYYRLRECVFRRSRPPIPDDSGRLFRTKSAICSD